MSPSGHRTCRIGPLLIDYDDRVLTPRPWTLQQSEWAAQLAEFAPAGRVLELCAGVGHIGLIASMLANRDLVQIEANAVAAEYARFNARRAGWAARVEIRSVRFQDGLQDDELFPIVIADPPYLRSADISRWPADPPAAIDGGPDGLTLVQECLQIASEHLHPEGQVLLQTAGAAQAEEVTTLLSSSPRWALSRRDLRTIDDDRAILLIGRDPT